MNPELRQMLSCHVAPVILLEGTRNLPQTERGRLVELAAWLAREFPHAVYRSGNAEGADETFAQAISPHTARLELVLPHPGMGRKRRPANARCVSLDLLPRSELERIAGVTGEVGRDEARLADYYLNLPVPRKGIMASKATYLLRDTLKVVGSAALNLSPANLGIFFVNPASPDGGGTGHTIRVCKAQRIPVAIQSDWSSWLAA